MSAYFVSMVGHAWRSLLFGIDGWRHYLKSGYESAAKTFDNAHLTRDLSGKHVMVTGANSGIGYETARQLALQGAHVHMVCRDEKRGTDARDAIRAEIRRASAANENSASASAETVHLRICDVSSQKQIRDLVRSYVASGNPLHVLINNAGCMVHERTVTNEGLETNFATNAVGVYALTEGLLPSLRESARMRPSKKNENGESTISPSRVICVSSAGMLTEKLEVDDPEMKLPRRFDGTKQYAKNKRMQVALCELWSRREKEIGKEIAAEENFHSEKVVFIAQHPGWSDTAAVKVALPGFYDSLKSRLRSALEGADTVIWLAAVGAEQLRSGAFYFDRKEVQKHVSENFLLGTAYDDARVLEMEKKIKDALERALGS